MTALPHAGNRTAVATETSAPRGYAICCEPRSGSTWLGSVLASTGVLGRPFEFFRDARAAARAEADPERVLAELVGRASTPNGVYGLKIFARQFDLAERTRWAERLPGLVFVHLEREDLLGQALSLARAEQMPAFRREDRPPKGPPVYDRGRIEAALRRIAHDQARWKLWFARNAIAPLRLTYEAAVADPHGAVRAIATHVGVEGEAQADLSKVTLAIVRNEETELWRARFLEESADFTRLDHPAGRLAVLLRRLRARLR